MYPWRVYYEYENTKVFIDLTQVYFLLLWVHFLFHCCGAVFSDMRPPCVLLNNTVWLANTVWRNIIVSRQCKTQILFDSSIFISPYLLLILDLIKICNNISHRGHHYIIQFNLNVKTTMYKDIALDSNVFSNGLRRSCFVRIMVHSNRQILTCLNLSLLFFYAIMEYVM